MLTKTSGFSRFATALCLAATALTMAGCPSDPLPFQVTRAYPESSEAAYPTNAGLFVRFSNTIDSQFIVEDSITVKASGGQFIPIKIQLHNHEMVIKPGYAWPASAELTVRLSALIQDEHGQLLNSDFVWIVKTGAGPDLSPPAIVSMEARGSGRSSVEIQFNKPINPISAREHVDLVSIDYNAPSFSESVQVDYETLATLYASPYIQGCGYDFEGRATVSAGLEDLAGNKLVTGDFATFRSYERCNDSWL